MAFEDGDVLCSYRYITAFEFRFDKMGLCVNDFLFYLALAVTVKNSAFYLYAFGCDLDCGFGNFAAQGLFASSAPDIFWGRFDDWHSFAFAANCPTVKRRKADFFPFANLYYPSFLTEDRVWVLS